MKKNHFDGRMWHRLHARNVSRRRFRKLSSWAFGLASPSQRHLSNVMIWQGGEVEPAISLRKPATPPRILCLKKNQSETIEYLAGMRRAATKTIIDKEKFVIRKDNNLPRIRSYTDYSKFEYMSTAAAVVLTAEYERLARLNDETPPTVDLHKWSEEVFRKLYQLGFFEIVGHVPKRSDVVIEYGSTRTMQIVSTENADDLGRIDRCLQDLGAFLNPNDNISEDIIVEILTALSEAISNVKHHAYPEDIILSTPSLGRLWVSATANKDNNSLTVVVYDQGASIPVTYPRMNLLERVNTFLKSVILLQPEYEYQNDGSYIHAAMQFGGSRTDKEYRGRGLPQMIAILGRIGQGQMTVYSRGGWSRKSTDGSWTNGFMNFSIGGTLIEWSLELPSIKAVV